MKKSIILLLAIVMNTAAWAAPSQHENLQPALVNTAASYLNNLSMDALAMLQIIASTQEAKQGNWRAIKPYLNQAYQRIPGVYFYALPDGNYYAMEKDFTNLNLRDRGYFKSLFEGNLIKGYGIYSRSSGQKSAVMAVPILVNGKVTGALGISIFLDDLHLRLNKEIGLPDGYTWFVVNADGEVMLDNDKDFIFMNALTQGTRSLKKAVTEVLQGDSGYTEYEIAGAVRKAVYKKLPSLDWWMILAKKEGGGDQTTAKMDISLNAFAPELQASLNTIDSKVQTLLADTKSNWDNEAEIRTVLNNVLKDSPLIFETAFIDKKGHIRYIEPREYKNFEGVDISSQEHVITLRQKQVPVFSAMFNAAEGFPAVDIAYPLYDKSNRLQGSLSLLFRPELMLRAILQKVHVPADYELWVMQPDGLIIYDDDAQEIGKNLFTDPIYADYESLQNLSRKISVSTSGQGDYVYQQRGHQGKVVKTARWVTVSLLGRDWRVVLAHQADSASEQESGH